MPRIARSLMLLAVVSADKRGPADDPLPALVAGDILRDHPFVKTVVAVDPDVDPGSAEDLLWAMTTRCNLSVDAHTGGGFTPLLMDPSQTPEWTRRRGGDGGTARTFVDATVPFELRERFLRSYR